MVTFIASGRDYKIINVSLTDAYADVQVSKSVKAFSIQVKGDSRVLWRKSATDTTEWTFREGQTYSIDGSLGTEDGITVTIGQAKCEATGGTDTLEVWCWF